MYNGLTTADKGALLDAKARGAEWVARDTNNDLYGYAVEPIDDIDYGWTTPFIGNVITINAESMKFVALHEKINIDLALAQIAEMESKPLTWNERINQMTVEEKARYFVYEDTLIDWEDDYNGDSTSTETPIYRSLLASDMFFYSEQDAIDATIELLNSPYTEGATK